MINYQKRAKNKFCRWCQYQYDLICSAQQFEISGFSRIESVGFFGLGYVDQVRHFMGSKQKADLWTGFESSPSWASFDCAQDKLLAG